MNCSEFNSEQNVTKKSVYIACVKHNGPGSEVALEKRELDVLFNKYYCSRSCDAVSRVSWY